MTPISSTIIDTPLPLTINCSGAEEMVLPPSHNWQRVFIWVL